MIEQSIHVRQMTPIIGAEISNVDLSLPLSSQTFQEIHDALMAHCVVFFREQPVTPGQLRDFASRFGVLDVHPYLPNVAGIPEVNLFENDRDRPAATNLWHTDMTFLKEPPMGAVLYAHHIPPIGGDTLWANMYAAYEALSEQMQHFLSGMIAVHEVDYAAYAKALGDQIKVDKDGVRSAEQPIVRKHPITGRKCLFVNAGGTKHIKGMKKSESGALLQMLFRHVELPEFQVRFNWGPHSIAVWDNRCTQHYAVADYWPERRLMYRVAIEGDKPY